MSETSDRRLASVNYKKEHNLRLSIPGKIIIENPEIAGYFAKNQDLFHMGIKKQDNAAYNNFCLAIQEQYNTQKFDIEEFINTYRKSLEFTASQIEEIGDSARFYTINLPSLSSVDYSGISIGVSEMHSAMNTLVRYLTKTVYTVEVQKTNTGKYNVHAHLIASKAEIEHCQEHVEAFKPFQIKISNKTKEYVVNGKHKNLASSAKRMANYIQKPFMTVHSDSMTKKWEKDPLFNSNYEIMRRIVKAGIECAKDFFAKKALEHSKLYLNCTKLKVIAKKAAFIPTFAYSKKEQVRNILFRIFSRKPSRTES